MKTIALLPARCGSKGIPYKNIYPINNVPMICYAIEAAKNSILDEIYVSTDCLEIEQIALSCDSKIIKRPPDISTDMSPTIDCIKHAIEYLRLDNNDTIVLIQPTSPMITSTDITNGIDTFNLGSYSSIISVTENHNILWEETDNRLTPKNHDPANRSRRQDMKRTFAETGAFYIFKVKNVIMYNTLYGNGDVGYISIPKYRSFQIDDYEDIKIVERLLNE